MLREYKNASSKKQILLYNAPLEDFNKIKALLDSKEVILVYPDFNQDYLTIDASSYALEEILEQSLTNALRNKNYNGKIER